MPPSTAPARTIGVDFVDEQDGAWLVAQRFEDGLEALLELAAVLGAGDERAQIQGVNLGVAQRSRHLAALDLESQALGDGCFADARIADVHRVVLAAAAQDLDGAFDFCLAPDKRIDAVLLGQLDQIDRKGGQRIARRAFGAGLAAGSCGLRCVVLFLDVAFGNAVRNVIQNVQLADALVGQQVNGVRARLLKHRRQDVAAVDRRLAGTLRLQQRALQNALE